MTEINETIDLMMNHTSVRNFTEEAIEPKDLEKILKAAQMASTWKNFQSYSVIVVESQDQKDAIYEFQPQKSIKNCAAYLVFVGDLNRAQKAVELHQGNFQPQGTGPGNCWAKCTVGCGVFRIQRGHGWFNSGPILRNF